MQFKLDNNQNISLEIVRKRNLKNIYLRVTPKGVQVSANKTVPLDEIEAFVLSKSAWLRKHLNIVKEKKKKQALISGNEVYYQGEACLLVCQEHQLPQVELEFKEQQFFIKMPKETEQEILEELFNRFYKNRAIEFITPMVELWSNKMSLIPTNIAFRKAKRQWGSCSSQNSLSFNYYLMKLPQSLVEYVVVHELAHIKEKNHSKNFWALVEQFLPNYKALVKELREFERLL